jgi:hypothetical protein
MHDYRETQTVASHPGVRHSVAFLALAFLSCSESTEPAKSDQYRADFSTTFVETTSRQGTLTCSDTYRLTGTVTVVIHTDRGADVAGDGSVNATQRKIAGPTGQCGPPERSTAGAWTAPLSGRVSAFGFAVDRSNGTSFIVKTAFAFHGAVSTDAVTGTLTFQQTGQGTIAGVAHTSNAGATIDLTLRR